MRVVAVAGRHRQFGSSCPPADRWLSSLKGQPGVIAAAFHVDYWNGLGWPDRFSSPAYTERQKQGVGVNGSRYAYTPQIVVTLSHDSVVRDYARLPAWDGRGRMEWRVPLTPAEPGHASRWIAVATDATNGAVLQAVEIGC
ncbi:MAG: DUF1223 domain-containing protein [Burkholderiales bacterium]|nr:DUF1223 domain-containing protein [Burkholderiales bacterium]